MSSKSSVKSVSIEKSWFSQTSDCSMTLPNPVTVIPVITGFRPAKCTGVQSRPAVRKVLRRENKCIQALSLPNLISYNMRSIWGKLKNFSIDVKERAGEVIFLSEVWEKSENIKHKRKLEELFEMENIQYISTPRPGLKRGG